MINLARVQADFLPDQIQPCTPFPIVSRLIAACHKDRGWCDAYGYALVATGRAEISIDPVVNIWDTAALLPVVTEAGGTLTDWKGKTTHTAPEALATNGKLLGPVLELIAG